MEKRTRVNILAGSATLALIVVVLGALFWRDVAFAALRATVTPAPDETQVLYGERLFATIGCGGCHTLESAGVDGDVGPDLSHIASRADADYIRQSIVEPSAVIAEGCPQGPCQDGEMLAFGAYLTDEQVEALVAYLLTQE